MTASRTMLACLVLAAGCGQTGGKLIEVGFSAGGLQRPARGPLTFDACAGLGPSCPARGWKITLQTARIALGPFYFNLNPPPTTEFRGGTVNMEATAQVVLDALDPALRTVPGGARGETGTSVSVEIGLLAPDAQALPADRQLLGTGFGRVAGTATNGVITVPFAGPLVINPSQVSQRNPLVALQRVKGADINLPFAPETSAVELRVDPTHWFDAALFEGLATGTQVDGAYTWQVNNCRGGDAAYDPGRCAFQNALVAGVQGNSGVYDFRVTP